VTLTELAVAAAITSIVLAGVGAVFVGSLKVTHVMQVKTSTSADVRIAMEEITRELRVAVTPKGEESALVSADGGSVTFYALLNRTGSAATSDVVPTKVAFSYDGTCVRVTKTPGTVVASPGPSGPYYTWTGGTTTCVLRTTSAPAFSYYPTGAITVSGVDVPPLAIPGGGLVLADRQQVLSVEVTLSAVDASSSTVPASTAMGRVTLANLVG
jgi:hypothetical protein